MPVLFPPYFISDTIPMGFWLFSCHSSFVTNLTLIAIYIHVVNQCLVSYAAESAVIRSDYKLQILSLFKIEVLFGLLLKPLLRYISSPRVDNKYVEKLL